MEKKKKSGAIHQLLDYAGNNKKQLYLSTFLATLGELFGMAPFIAVSLLVAELFNKTATIQNVCILFAVALGGQILKLWLTYQSSFMSHKATYKILKNIRSMIADKMLRVPMGVMLDTPTGNFKNLMADTVSKLEDSMAHFMPEITSNIVAPLCCILLVFILDWRMGLAALITIPLGLLGYIGMMKDYVNKSTTYMKSQNAMNSTLVEYVNGIEVIKAFNQGSASYSKFTGAINFFHDSTLAWWKQSWLWSAVIQAVMPTTLLGTLPIGAWLYMTGTLPLSDFITCIILPIGFIAPLMRVGKYSEQFNMVKACLDQIREFMRFLPSLKQDAIYIKQGMKTRGVGLSFWRVLSHPAQTYEGFLIPILMRLLMTATELSASAETRGISYPCKKTHYILVDFRLRDGLLLIGMLALFAVVIWTSFQPISLF